MKINRTIKIANLRIAILFAAFLPTFNIIINSQQQNDLNFNRLLLTLPVTFLFLLVAWYVNAFLTFYFTEAKTVHSRIREILIIIGSNLLLLSLFLLSGIYILKETGNVPLKNHFALWLITLKGAVSIGLIYIIQYALNSSARAQEISMQNQMLKMENLRSQFEILRQQVNPHFLFNSLSTLRSMVRSGDPKSEQFVMTLSEIYRQLLDKRQKDLVTLEEELEFVNDYVFMLSARFGERLAISIDLPGQLMSLKIPTFSLQLLIENGIKHNMISPDKPLEIKLFSTLPETITVENKLQPKITSEEHSGYGLENLVQRYRLLGYPDGVFIYTDDEIFRVKLKLLNT
ncbi:sensor histidine kinase [Prolixibacter sp. SD074]|uniref:sensor histidine kinase n=1 Tax=Prolixibacter sp. SD074 TaxID=2652391 RepID=UPI001276D7C9|nr:histidine kinase [Prolixibacter sp. SD074]GET29208.1 histidine kinase [Prolixibacter sp. SD074]